MAGVGEKNWTPKGTYFLIHTIFQLSYSIWWNCRDSQILKNHAEIFPLEVSKFRGSNIYPRDPYNRVLGVM